MFFFFERAHKSHLLDNEVFKTSIGFFYNVIVEQIISFHQIFESIFI